jgi:cullin 1
VLCRTRGHDIIGRITLLANLCAGTRTDDTTMTASPSMPSSTADLATAWAFLEDGIDHIMTTHNPQADRLPYIKYMSLYTVAYNYCTSSKSNGASSGAIGTGNRSKSPECTLSARNWADLLSHFCLAGENLMGAGLYCHLIEYFINHVKGLQNVRTSCFVSSMAIDQTYFRLEI